MVLQPRVDQLHLGVSLGRKLASTISMIAPGDRIRWMLPEPEMEDSAEELVSDLRKRGTSHMPLSCEFPEQVIYDPGPVRECRTSFVQWVV